MKCNKSLIIISLFSLMLFPNLAIAQLQPVKMHEKGAHQVFNHQVALATPFGQYSADYYSDDMKTIQGTDVDYNADGFPDIAIHVAVKSILYPAGTFTYKDQILILDGKDASFIAKTQPFTNSKQIKHFSLSAANNSSQPYIIIGNKIYKPTIGFGVLNLGQAIVELRRKFNVTPSLAFGEKNFIKRIPGYIQVLLGTPGLGASTQTAGTQGMITQHVISESALQQHPGTGSALISASNLTKFYPAGHQGGFEVAYSPNSSKIIVSSPGKLIMGPNGNINVNSPWKRGVVYVYSSAGALINTINNVATITTAYPYSEGSRSAQRIILGQDLLGRELILISQGSANHFRIFDLNTGQLIGTINTSGNNLSSLYNEYEIAFLGQLQTGTDAIRVGNILYNLDGTQLTQANANGVGPYRIGDPSGADYKASSKGWINVRYFYLNASNNSYQNIALFSNFAETKLIGNNLTTPSLYLEMSAPTVLGLNGNLAGNFAAMGPVVVPSSASQAQLGDRVVMFFAKEKLNLPIPVTNSNGVSFDINVMPSDKYVVKAVSSAFSISPSSQVNWIFGLSTDPDYVRNNGTRAYAQLWLIDAQGEIKATNTVALEHGRPN